MHSIRQTDSCIYSLLYGVYVGHEQLLCAVQAHKAVSAEEKCQRKRHRQEVVSAESRRQSQTGKTFILCHLDLMTLNNIDEMTMLCLFGCCKMFSIVCVCVLIFII